MANENPQSLFRQKYQEIFDQASVREVIEAYGLTLTKSGRNYKTACPFHSDHDPSLSIRQDDKVWKCFACNESGNAISFVQKYENKVLGNRAFTTLDAMKKVVEICQLNIDLDQLQDRNNDLQYIHNHQVYNEHQKELLEDLDKIMKSANLFLMKSTDERGKNYLIQRGFNEDLINQLQFGFLPKEQVIQMIEKQIISLQNMVDIGFVRYNQETSRYYPTYGDRVLIPICDENGRIVTFSGRAMLGEEPKYLHGNNTEIFAKSNHLYNYHRAKNYAYGDKLYVVEGFMDVAGGNKIGIQNIVATMGTSFSQEQLDMIRRLNCEIVLLRDNDKPGKTAMLKEIPELLKQGFTVSAIDLNEVKESMELPEQVESKDLWDFANAGVTPEDLRSNTMSAFHFILNNLYFENKNFTTETIRKAFETAKQDGYIITEADKMSFKDYIESKSTYTRNEIESIISDTPIDQSPFMMFQNNLMLHYIQENAQTYIKKNGDSIMNSFFNEQYASLVKDMYDRLKNSPTDYVNNDFSEIKIDKLVQDTFADNEKWRKFNILQRFSHDNIFDHVYVKNASNQSIPLTLSAEQKREVTKQFESTLSNEVRLNMGEVDELYIYNNVSDLDKILDVSKSQKGSNILRAMKQQCLLRDNIMHVFSFENVFDKNMMFAIDSKFKSEDGTRFKKILLFDNRIEKIKITKSNLKHDKVKENEISKNRQLEKSNDKTEKQNNRTENKSFTISLNRSLIMKEDDNQFFVRIPNTKGKYYMFIPKELSKWVNNSTLYVNIPNANNFNVYDKNEKSVHQFSKEKMLQYWESKNSDNKMRILSNKKMDLPHQNVERTFEPFEGYTISANRIISKGDRSYEVLSSIDGYHLFIPRKYFRETSKYQYALKNISGTVTAKGTISDIQLAKETHEGIEFQNLIPFNELDKHLSEKENPLALMLIAKEKNITEVANNLVQIPIYKDRKYYHVLLEKQSLMRINADNIGYSATPYHELYVLNQEGKKIGFVTAKDLSSLHQEATKERLNLDKEHEVKRSN